MRYAEACAGISAASLAWERLGWRAVWYSEIGRFPSKVLAYHYPHVDNLGDLLTIENNEQFINTDFDLLAGGTPCQDFSLAGLRRGVAGKRGNLALEFCRILRIKRPRWFLWENVPGVLSVDKGWSFGAILEGFRECGYSFCWRVLDAQYFGVPQQRQRVFVVGYLGDWRPPAAVLFDGAAVGETIDQVCPQQEDAPGNNIAGIPGTDTRIFDINSITRVTDRSNPRPGGPSPTLTRRGDFVAFPEQRRLTPKEFERLFGFPDDYTRVEKASDSARRQMLGNSIPVPVLSWIGQRIDRIDKLFTNQ
jgi:DNA (cytosine-5)-methyltransferase 1